MHISFLKKSALFIAISALFTACAVQGSTGLLGVLFSSSLVTVILLLTGGSQSGCDDSTATIESGPVDVGPCLSIVAGTNYAGTDEAGTDEAGESEPGGYVGPCLSAPPAGNDFAGDQPPINAMDMGVSDMSDAEMGEADMGDADVDEADMGEADMGDIDMEIGPCLSAPAPDMGSTPEPNPDRPDQKQAARQHAQRATVVDRLAAKGALPADVLNRLKKR